MRHAPVTFEVVQAPDAYHLRDHRGQVLAATPSHQEAVAAGIARVYETIRVQKYGKEAS
jgi:hypothetical protein